jgi:ribosomal protein L40E
MIVCPNCKHENPEGATSCEACFTALPATKACPTCGASVQLDATFCGQCGQNLTSTDPKNPIQLPAPAATEPVNSGLPPTVMTGKEITAPPLPAPPVASEVPAQPLEPAPEVPSIDPAPTSESALPPTVVAAAAAPVESASAPVVELPPAPVVATQVQPTVYHLLHLQTNTSLEIPQHLQVVHIGKPNEQSPPDIDVSGFPSAEVVSRIHANIRIEGQEYYIEDVGSANGTYINHNVLAKGNRHLLRSGDRIGLGKGDLVTFIFQ